MFDEGYSGDPPVDPPGPAIELPILEEANPTMGPLHHPQSAAPLALPGAYLSVTSKDPEEPTAQQSVSLFLPPSGAAPSCSNHRRDLSQPFEKQSPQNEGFNAEILKQVRFLHNSY